MALRHILLLLLAGLLCCGKTNNGNGQDTNPPVNSNFAKGADISWLTEMEAAGKLFYNSSGTSQDCIQLLKNMGTNSIRLRVWVDPAGGWNNTADVIAKAVRAKNLGMKIMIDFHYSDTWADPGQQNKPAAWVMQDFTTLQQSVYNHTFEVLTSLKNAGITPEWVQVGNETNDGMLWPTGKASINMPGMSLYPDPANWETINTQCLSNINDMISRYNKPVMICEAGMSWDQPAACRSFLTDLIAKLKSVPGNYGLGVFYWEPQCYGNWKGYSKGAFDNSGKPTVALQAFN